MSPLALALHDEVGKLKEFIKLLQREQDLLKAGDTEALIPLIESKNTLATDLGKLAQLRETTLERMKLPAGRGGMEAWLAQPDSVTFRPAWQTLLDLAGQARELNATNGKLIGVHLSHNQQAFAALMGAANHAMTYGPDGQQQSGLGGRILGTA